MKISELSSRAGVSIPTLKFYLREGLLPQGHLSSPNQADYDETHVRRADLIRALRDIAGLSIAKIKAIVDALEQGEELFDVMGSAVDSLGGETIEGEFSPAQQSAAVDIDRFLESMDLPTRPESLARHQLIAAFASVREMLFPDMPAEFLAPYAQAAIQISSIERASTPGLFELEPELAVEKAVLGIALFEPILVGFRRLAHEREVQKSLRPIGGELPRTSAICRRCESPNTEAERLAQSTRASITASTIASALARISSSVASWIGCGTKIRRTSGKPSASDCEMAAPMNSLEAMNTEGFPLISNQVVSCTLHVVQDPQSASASMTKPHSSAIFWRRSIGAGLVNVGFA